MTIFNKTKLTILLGTAIAATSLSSCKKFIELGPPPTQTVLDTVFKLDGTATSAILGLYSTSAGGLSTIITPYSLIPGISADDIQLTSANTLYDEFRSNSINPVSNTLNENNLWYNSYAIVKNANNAIIGLTNSGTLTPSLKNQLLGEAKFVRAFVYFHLVNFYGGVPLVLKSDADFMENAMLPRTPVAQVWAQIIADLKDADASLATAYTGSVRAVRVNKWAAVALLARAYLYTKDYANAEAAATRVIASGTYSLPALASAFINSSPETLFQIGNANGVTNFGINYQAVVGGTPSVPAVTMYDTLYRSFGNNDLRKTVWAFANQPSGSNITYYWVNKYKARTGTGNEYSVVLRLAEQYLIRGEARAQQNNLTGAKADVDSVRTRAGLSGLSTTLTQAQMLLAIEQERKWELFGEWGHRWFDLKRTGRADAVIGGQKPSTWQSTDVLYPIPQSQRLANPNLTQNPGY